MVLQLCEVCDYSTNDLSNFSKHCKTKKHINLSQAYEAKLKAERKSKYNFVCDVCHKRFPQSRDLARHTNRYEPCGLPQAQSIQQANQINNIGTQNNNDNSITNNISLTLSADFSELKQLAICKDDKYLMTHIQHKVEDIMEAQERFNRIANEEAILRMSKLEKKHEFEERHMMRCEEMGIIDKMEVIDVYGYRIDLTDVVIKTFFDRDNKHLSLFREPDVEDMGKWWVKHMSKAFDPNILVNLVNNCPQSDHFDSNCFEKLDFGKIGIEYRQAMTNLMSIIDRKRNGFNQRTRK